MRERVLDMYVWHHHLIKMYYLFPFDNTVSANERGLLGPVIILLVIVLLNIAVLAVALRLRRMFRQIEEEADDEQTQATD